MNSKDYDDVPNVQLKITSDGRLVGTISKIGSMPGTIDIDFLVYIDEVGDIEADSDVAGTLKIAGAIPVTTT